MPTLGLHPPLQLLALLKSSAPYVRSEADWRTVCAIIKLTSGGSSQARLPTVEGLNAQGSRCGLPCRSSRWPALRPSLQRYE